MKRVFKLIGGVIIAIGVTMVLGTIGTDDRMVMGCGVGMPWSELIQRLLSGLAICGIGSLAIMAGNVIRRRDE